MKTRSFFFVQVLILYSLAQAYTNLSPRQVHDRLVQKDTLLLVDVREVSEYRRGHIAEPSGQLPLTPVNLPYNSGVLSAVYQRLPKNRDIIVYCASGGRSAAASAFLQARGFSRIFNMSGGFSAWTFESRRDGYGDHSGKWVHFSASRTTTVYGIADQDSSWLVFPDAVLPGDDSIYVELHWIDAQTPVPPDIPVSDVKGLFRITVLDSYGFSKMTGDTLALAQPVEISLAPRCLVDRALITNTALASFVPGEGWRACSYDYQSYRFLRSETVLYTWYNVAGFKTTGITRTVAPDQLEIAMAYPNPFNGAIQVAAPPGSEISVFDIRGRLLERLPTNRWLPTATTASGLYFIQVRYLDKVWIRKISYIR